MNLSKVGNQTSSQDPQAINSRVFVGNLNTFQVNKIDVEKVFQRYGRIAGISMHKGYAFVQFTSPFDARSACLGEDGKVICGQTIDVNMVSEPKSTLGKVKGQKRPRESSPSNSTDNISSCSKDAEETVVSVNGCQEKQPLKVYDNPDILICGNCKEYFNELSDIIQHKKNYCKLRFACKCGPKTEYNIQTYNATMAMEKKTDVCLLCCSCREGFANPWDLMVHVQTSHDFDIYTFGDEPAMGDETMVETQNEV